MPISLPPLSRRRFLARALAVGAGLVVSPKLLGASKDTDEQSWALLSDLHLAAERSRKVQGVNMADHFGAVAGELLALPRRPAGIFVTGDCACNQGEPGDYALLAELLAPLRKGQMPVHLALGNHDHREHFWTAFEQEKAAQRPLNDRHVALVRTPLANWFVLDSLETTLSTPGLLGREQLDWLAKSLDANPDKPALVLLHHNPGLNGGNMGLKDTPAFLELLRPRKQVKAYIYGHTHRWKVEADLSGIHLVNLPPVSYVFHQEDPAGWVQATLQPTGMRLELRCVEPRHKAHGQVVELKWRA